MCLLCHTWTYVYNIYNTCVTLYTHKYMSAYMWMVGPFLSLLTFLISKVQAASLRYRTQHCLQGNLCRPFATEPLPPRAAVAPRHTPLAFRGGAAVAGGVSEPWTPAPSEPCTLWRGIDAAAKILVSFLSGRIHVRDARGEPSLQPEPLSQAAFSCSFTKRFLFKFECMLFNQCIQSIIF